MEEAAAWAMPGHRGGAGGEPVAREAQHRVAGPGHEARGEPGCWREAARQEEARRSTGQGGKARRPDGAGVSNSFCSSRVAEWLRSTRRDCFLSCASGHRFRWRRRRWMPPESACNDAGASSVIFSHPWDSSSRGHHERRYRGIGQRPNLQQSLSLHNVTQVFSIRKAPKRGLLF